MKLFLTALFASFMVIPAVFADEDCGKCKKGAEKKQEGTMLVHCGKCEGDKKKEEKKAEGTTV
jgi:hypothetical protein